MAKTTEGKVESVLYGDDHRVMTKEMLGAFVARHEMPPRVSAVRISLSPTASEPMMKEMTLFYGIDNIARAVLTPGIVSLGMTRIRNLPNDLQPGLVEKGALTGSTADMLNAALDLVKLGNADALNAALYVMKLLREDLELKGTLRPSAQKGHAQLRVTH